ncbi:MAG TPA: PCMD domain-containing protein [Bacteroidia bacterium]|jgi:hypothetical protein|nr:PCMD domain-containing protein [Bacteroidia bacterium]
MKKHLLALSILALAFTVNTTKAQILNPGFENWTHTPTGTFNPVAYDDPNGGSGTTGWWDFNILSSSLAGTSPLTVFKDSTTVHSGKYSAKIVTAPMSATSYGYYKAFFPHDTMGCIIAATISAGIGGVTVKTGIPFTQRISQFNFYYQYAPVATDTGSCSVVLYKFNPVTKSRYVIAAGVFATGTATGATWQQATVNMVYDTAVSNPDTVVIVFSSSSLYHKPQVGSTLLVDDASVVAGINELHAAQVNVNVYPNPSSTEVNFAITSTEMANHADIYDITGQKINSYDVKNNFAAISTANYAPGLYLYQIYDKSGSVMKIGKFTVSR